MSPAMTFRKVFCRCSQPCTALQCQCGQWQGISCIPDFINAAEEAELLRHIDAAPAGRWIACGDGRRRTQNWGGRPGRREVTEVLPPCPCFACFAVPQSSSTDPQSRV